MINMQGYLASSGTDANLVLGSSFEFAFDKNAYDSKVQALALQRGRQGEQGDVQVARRRPDERKRTNAYSLEASDGKTEPGIYVYRFLEKRGEGGKAMDVGATRPDYRALPYNVDALAEGNLARANTDDVTQISKAPLHTASDADDEYKKVLQAKRKDLSENPWLYFVMLLVLIFEQAMAVRLSFHTRAAEVSGPGHGPAGDGVVRWDLSVQLVLQVLFAGRERHERPGHPAESEFVFRRLTETFKVFGTEAGRPLVAAHPRRRAARRHCVRRLDVHQGLADGPLVLGRCRSHSCASASTCSSPSCS